MAGMENHCVMMRELMKFQHGKREFMKETDLMRACIFSAMMNIAAAIILFGKGAPEMNHLETGIPAVLCTIAAILVIIQIRKEKEGK